MFSIVIPFIDRVGLLLQTLETIENQPLCVWELILVDDGSKEDQVEILLKRIAGNNQIFYHKRPHNVPSGGNGARNYGLRYSRYPWVIFYDSDDLLMPNALMKRYFEIGNNPGNDIYIFNTGFYNSSTNEFKVGDRLPASIDESVHRLFDLKIDFNTGSLVWSKDFIKRIGGWNERLLCFQDFECFIRATHNTLNIWFDTTKDTYHFYRLNSGASIASKQKTKDYKLNAFNTALEIEKYLSARYNASFTIFIRKYFIIWSGSQLGLFFCYGFIFHRYFFSRVSRIKYLWWCLINTKKLFSRV